MLMPEDWSSFRLLVTMNVKGTIISYLMDHVSQEDFIEEYMKSYRGYTFNIETITLLSRDSFELLVPEMEQLPGVFILS